MKRFWIGATLISMLMSAPALAQYPDDDDDDDSGTTTTTSKPAASGSGTTPSELTLAVGAGVAFPGDIRVFDRFSAKVYLANAMQIEPFVTAGINRGTTLTDDGTNETEDLTGVTSIGAGAQVYYPFKQGNRVHLHIIGTGVFSFASAEVDPEGPDNSVTDATTSLGVRYGAGVEFWPWRNLSVSAFATNPLITFSNNVVTTSTPGDDLVATTRDFTFEATWAPSVVWQVNWWFN